MPKAEGVWQDGKVWRWRASANVVGRRVRSSGTAATQGAAKAARVAALTHLRTKHADGGQRTLGQLLDAWEEASEPAASSLSALRAHRVALAPLIGRRIDKISPEDIQALYVALAKNRSANTVRRINSTLRSAFDQAVRWRWIPFAPTSGVVLPDPVAPNTQLPSDSQVKALMAAVAGNAKWSLALRILSVSAIRRSELCGLRWAHVDIEAGTIEVAAETVHAAPGVGVVVRPRGKSPAARRTIVLDAGTVDLLVAARDKMVSEAGTARDIARRWVISPLPDGSRPMRPDSVTQQFSRIRARVGVPGVRLHDLRHHTLTLLAEELTTVGEGRSAPADLSLLDLQRMAGHSSLTTTLARYVGHRRSAPTGLAATAAAALDKAPDDDEVGA